MKSLPITKFGDPILRSKAKRVDLKFLKTSKFKTLIKDMVHTMRRNHGIGLAAPQIGKSLQIVVMETRPSKARPDAEHRGPFFVINPKITSYSKNKVKGWEGCVSIHGIMAIVSRSKKVSVSYYNENGKKILEEVSGLWARLFQHEVDHLNGIGFLDRVEDTKTIITLEEFNKRFTKKKKINKK
ncbi:MAG: peptide deformylase [Candidatus Paceibacterota bacterium]|jgi:peptide deformylase